MKIREVLRTKGHDLHTVQASDKLSDVLGAFTDAKIRCLVVSEGSSLRGLLTLRDVVSAIDRGGASALDESVQHAMTRDVVSITPDTTVDEAEAIFSEKRFNHLPVEEDGVLVGLVTPPDVLARHLGEAQEATELMHAYCSGTFY